MIDPAANTRTRAARAAMAGAALLAFIAATAPAGAQDRGNTRRFHPSPLLSPYLTLDGAFTHGQGELGAMALFSYERRPLIFFKDGRRTADLVGSRSVVDLAVAYGVLEWLDVGLAVPVSISQSGRTVGGTDTLTSFAIGDPALAAKARLLDSRDAPVGLALIAGVTAPLGDAEAYLGEANLTARAGVALEIPLGSRADLGFNLAYRLRERSQIDEIVLDDELIAGLGASWRLTPGLALVGELTTATRAASPFSGAVEERPADLNAGVRIPLFEGLQLVLGGGSGLQPGYGSPEYRVFAGLEAKPRRHDFDGDRVLDGDDACVETPGLVAHQGCPPPPPPPAPVASHAPDRDGDGIPDEDDLCPTLPEDRDGFRDDDGCPEPDNDLDLIADVYDADPLAPEDWDGFEDDDGIPDLDNDRDGVPDYLDGCPNEKGGRDGCPGSPPLEGAPGLAGASGLPRPDGPHAPVVLGQLIHPATPILFEFARAELTPKAAPLIEGLAKYLNDHPALTPVEVGVHVDAMGNRAWKHDLSRRRAESVRAALVAQGVAPARLTSRGYGPEVPVDTNQTKEGRLRNRRVELRVARPDIERAVRPGGALALLPGPQDTWHAPEDVVVRPPAPIVFVARRPALTKDGRAQVVALARVLSARPEYRRLEIGVHTDGVGNPGWKLRLSQARAESVRDALVAEGIDPERLVARGYGARRRLRPDKTISDRFVNRRVELLVLDGRSGASPLRGGPRADDDGEAQ